MGYSRAFRAYSCRVEVKMSRKGGVFWSKEGVRHKIPGLISDEMRDAEVTDEGIKFFKRGSHCTTDFIRWEDVYVNSRKVLAEVK